jgi:hypothetical protein
MSVSASNGWLRRWRAGQWLFLGLPALAALSCFGPLPAAAADLLLAQVGAPTQLLPPGQSGGGEAAPAAPQPPPTVPAPELPAPPPSFEVDQLDAASLDYAGTLETGQGGLGAGMWRGTDRIAVERLLPRLRPTVSPALADLTRRLVLSAAAAPSGKGSGQSLFVPRAKILADMGLVADALALLRLMPANQEDPAAARLLSELAFRAGDADTGCNTVRDSVAKVPVDSFWQEALIFCQLRAGDAAQASLSLDLLREEQGNDPTFFALADALAGSKAEIASLPLVEPLYLAMVQAAKLPLPKLAVREPPPAMLALVAESGAADPARRLEAGEAAALIGLLPPERLAEIYAAQPADAAALDGAPKLPDGGATPRDRALLYQAAKRATDPTLRLQLAQKALAKPVNDPAYWLQVRLYGPLLAELTPPPAVTPAAAAVAARSLYADGRFEAARRWLQLLRDQPATATEAAAALPPLQALDYIAGGDQPAPLIGPILEARRNQGADVGQSASDLPGGRLRAILDAFDESVEAPASDAEGTLTAATSAAAVDLPQSDLNLWLNLGDAASQGRVGEAVLVSLVELETAGLDGIEALWLERVIRSLRRVGLEADARRIAVEAAIANGL